MAGESEMSTVTRAGTGIVTYAEHQLRDLHNVGGSPELRLN